MRSLEGGGGGNESIGQLTDRIPDDMVPQVKIVKEEKFAIPHYVANFCGLQDGTLAFVDYDENVKWLRRLSEDMVVTNMSGLPSFYGNQGNPGMYVFTDYNGRIFVFGSKPSRTGFVVDLNGVSICAINSYSVGWSQYYRPSNGSYYYTTSPSNVVEVTAGNVTAYHALAYEQFGQSASNSVLTIGNMGIYAESQIGQNIRIRCWDYAPGGLSTDVQTDDSLTITDLLGSLRGSFVYAGFTYLVTGVWEVYRLNGSVAERVHLDAPPSIKPDLRVGRPNIQAEVPGFAFINVGGELYRAKMPGMVVVNHPHIASWRENDCASATVRREANGSTKVYASLGGGNPTTLAVTTLK